MTVTTRCPNCQRSLKVPAKAAGKKVRCPDCQGVFLFPAPAAGPSSAPAPPVGESLPIPVLSAVNADPPAAAPVLPGRPEHTLRPFPAGLMLFLGLATGNVFATLRLLWLHEAFPRRRPNDPSGWKAIGFACIPFYGLYWGPFALARLVTRLNEQRREWGLPELPLTWLVVPLTLCTCSVFLALPAALVSDEAGQAVVILAALLSWLLFVPLFGTSVQNGANALEDVTEAWKAPDPGVFLVQTELKWRARQRTLWAIYLSSFLPLLLLVALVALATGGGREVLEVILGWFCLLTPPLLAGVLSLMFRARIMRARIARLDREPGAVEEVVAAERRTSWLYQAGWLMPFVLAAVGLSLAAATNFQWTSPRWLRHETLPFMLVMVVPAWTVALHLLGRVLQGNRRAPGAAPGAARGLQAQPMPWWPGLASAAFAVLVVAGIGIWASVIERVGVPHFFDRDRSRMEEIDSIKK